MIKELKKYNEKIIDDKELIRDEVCAKFAYTNEHGAVKGKV